MLYWSGNNPPNNMRKRRKQSDLPMVLIVLALIVGGFLYFAFIYSKLQGPSGDFWRQLGASLIGVGALVMLFWRSIKVWTGKTVKKLKNTIGIF